MLATDDGYLAVGNTAVELLGGQRGWVLSVGTSGERQAQLRTQPADMDVGQFQRVRPFEDGYALVGVGQPSTADAASVWMAGIDDELTEQWSGTEQYVDGSQGVTALVTDDDGLLVFGNVNVEGGRLRNLVVEPNEETPDSVRFDADATRRPYPVDATVAFETPEGLSETDGVPARSSAGSCGRTTRRATSDARPRVDCERAVVVGASDRTAGTSPLWESVVGTVRRRREIVLFICCLLEPAHAWIAI
ncbi:hypothetical protein BRD06_02570 [Halobacteriales archaeon QS_9_67_15]|nr:MAG: hypothetical protein BRD06_02570 [Halobacteriales archaeon QS_9_67_15]